MYNFWTEMRRQEDRILRPGLDIIIVEFGFGVYGVLGSLVRQEPNNSVYLASYY